ncbi:MAG TPA: ribosome biogenesis GTP-binding protein YihA/YsxC [Terriglobales bacterium]|jgi:GTP-binding protein
MIAATNPGHFPVAGLPEIAFLGRSNVGKSSVINSLVGKKLARTSNTPGRTQSINFFEVRWPGNPRPELLLADLPGYGYARVPQQVSARWADFIDPYVKERAALALYVALIDPNVPRQASDEQLLEFLTSTGRPFVVVATKCDRLPGSRRQAVLEELERDVPNARIIAFSAKTGLGRDELWREIRASVESHRAVAS